MIKYLFSFVVFDGFKKNYNNLSLIDIKIKFVINCYLREINSIFLKSINKMIYKYIIKNFLKKLFLILSSMFVLISILNVFSIDQSEYDFNFLQIVKLVTLKTPIFLEEIFMFIVMISAIVAFQDMMISNELTIIRIAGFSITKIVTFISMAALAIGLIFVTIVSPIAVLMNEKSEAIEKKLSNKDNSQYISDVWLKESDEINNNRIFYIKKINKKNYDMNSITIWNINENKKFSQRINAKTMKIVDKEIVLQDVIINSKSDINKNIDELKIKTNLNQKIIEQYNKNNEKKPREVIYKIPEVEDSLKKIGVSSRKINLYFHNLLSKPILLVVACILAAIFGIGHSYRNKKNVIYIVCGILLGLILHILISIIHAFGISGVLEVFISTWFVAIILFLLSSSLLIKKEI